LKKVKKAISKLRDTHDELYRKASAQYKLYTDPVTDATETERIIMGIWEYNGLK
jgi:hypothetical protein